MAEVNTSLYPQPAPPGNLLGMVGQFASAQNQLNQNALFQQTFKARQALGPLAQQSIGPDGQMDYNKFAVLISAHPDTAWMAPDIINGIVQRQNLQADTILKNLSIAQNKAASLGDLSGALVSSGKDGQSYKDQNGAPVTGAVDQRDIVGMAAQLVALHKLEPGDAIGWAARVGVDPQTGKFDPKKAYSDLLNFSTQQQGAAKTLAGTFQDYTQKFGGGTQVGTRNIYRGGVTPATGPGVQPGGVVPETSGPGFETVQTTGANAGQTQKTTVGQPLPAVGPHGGPGIESLMLPNKDQSRVGGGLAAGQGTAAPSAAAGPAAPYGVPSQTTALSPMQSEQLKDTAKYADNLRNTVSGMQSQMQQIGEMGKALKEFNPGAGKEALMNLAGVMQTAGASPEVYNAVVGGDPQHALAAAQEFQKLSMQNATQQMINLLKGQGRLAVAEFIASLKNNPNVNMTREATERIFNFTKRIYDLNSHELSGYEKWTAPPEQGGYGRDPTQFRGTWNNLMRKSGGSLDTDNPAQDLSPLIDTKLRKQIDSLPKGQQ